MRVEGHQKATMTAMAGAKERERLRHMTRKDCGHIIFADLPRNCVLCPRHTQIVAQAGAEYNAIMRRFPVASPRGALIFV